MSRIARRYFASIRSTNGNCAGFVAPSLEPEFRAVCAARTPLLLVWGRADASVPYSHCQQLHAIAASAADGGQEGSDDGSNEGSGVVTSWVREVSFEGIPHNVFYPDARQKEVTEAILDFVTSHTALDR